MQLSSQPMRPVDHQECVHDQKSFIIKPRQTHIPHWGTSIHPACLVSEAAGRVQNWMEWLAVLVTQWRRWVGCLAKSETCVWAFLHSAPGGNGPLSQSLPVMSFLRKNICIFHKELGCFTCDRSIFPKAYAVCSRHSKHIVFLIWSFITMDSTYTCLSLWMVFSHCNMSGDKHKKF